MSDEYVEEIDPIRFIYNSTPNTKILQAKSSIPAAFHYSPCAKKDIACLEYIPITCQCEAVHNPFSQINFNQKSVRCCICGTTSQLPGNYAQSINPNKLPYEFMQQNDTIEFKSGNKVKDYHYGYLFVIDVNLEEK